MSAARFLREPGRRVATCLAVATVVSLATASAAGADTTFGGNPYQPVIPEVTAEVSCAPFTCTLLWAGPGGKDMAPIPAGGGSGTVTSVTLPPMANPGTMQAVVLTSSVQATKDPTQPTTACCTVKELSAPFTVPPNQVTTVPLSLHVSATPAVDPSAPGDTATADGVGISILSEEVSAPLRVTEAPADVLQLWSPALTAPSSGTVAPLGERPGYELEARFSYVETPGGGKPSQPGGPGSPGSGTGAASGLALHRGPLRPGRDGRTLVLGTAVDPPTASTRQTLSAPATALAAAGGKAKKPLVLGVGRTTVPAGRKATLALALDRRARVALAEAHLLKATLTVVATDAEGRSETVTRRVTVRPAAKPRPR